MIVYLNGKILASGDPIVNADDNYTIIKGNINEIKIIHEEKDRKREIQQFVELMKGIGPLHFNDFLEHIDKEQKRLGN